MQGFNGLSEEVVFGCWLRVLTTQWAHTYKLNIKPFTKGHVPLMNAYSAFCQDKGTTNELLSDLTILNQASPQGHVFHTAPKNVSFLCVCVCVFWRPWWLRLRHGALRDHDSICGASTGTKSRECREQFHMQTHTLTLLYTLMWWKRCWDFIIKLTEHNFCHFGPSVKKEVDWWRGEVVWNHRGLYYHAAIVG